MMKSILTIAIFLSLVVSGAAQTRNVVAGTNGAVVSPTNFWSADASNARTGLGLGTAATNPATAFQPSSLALSNLVSSNGSALTNIPVAGVVGALATNGNGSGLTNLTAANIAGIVALASNVTGTIAISNGGSGAATAGVARTNLSLGWSALTNSNTATALVGYDTNNGNVVMPSSITFSNNVDFSKAIFATTNGVSAGGTLFAGSGSTISFYGPDDQARWRTNLGLGLSALTNTNPAGFNTSLYGSGTNPVLYNTNGEVVSPTNFWQVAPIVTRFVEFDPATNATTNIVAARNLHIHSLAISRTGVTSTIALPITNSFNGDIALVVHQGPTSSVTAVRTAGAATNLVTLNQFEEAVEFVYYNNVWQFNHNRSFIEPIFFSGTNAVANAAASRTNLGGTTVGNAVFTATSAGAAAAAVGLSITNAVEFSTVFAASIASPSFLSDASLIEADLPISFSSGAEAGTRTNLGLPLPALTNTSNVTLQSAVFTTNAAPTNSANVNAINFNTAVRWMEITLDISGTNQTFRIPLFQ